VQGSCRYPTQPTRSHRPSRGGRAQVKKRPVVRHVDLPVRLLWEEAPHALSEHELPETGLGPLRPPHCGQALPPHHRGVGSPLRDYATTVAEVEHRDLARRRWTYPGPSGRPAVPAGTVDTCRTPGSSRIPLAELTRQANRQRRTSSQADRPPAASVLTRRAGGAQ